MKISSCIIGFLLIFIVIGHGSQSVTPFCGGASQASQDIFVYTLLYCVEKKADRGFYLEVGAADPIISNNTYCLEKQLCWEGVSIEINPEYQDSWKRERQNLLLVEDGKHADYIRILQSFPKVIDYLSIDINDEYDRVLNKIPLDQYIFKVITIEHDCYNFGAKYKESEREILSLFGYILLCPDVTYPGIGSFEDWWIHPAGFTEENLNKLLSLDLAGKYHYEVISIIVNQFHCE